MGVRVFSGLPRAAESARSLQEHLDWISKRRAFWRGKAIAIKSDNAWKKWVLEKLEPAFQRVAKTLICHSDFKSSISSHSLFISPSDFGLHNAIRTESGTLVFIDFEYGGWDDPAKTLCDFFLQPRATPPASLFETWKQSILDILPIEERNAFVQRLPLIHACCSIKWIYIILKNRLDPLTFQAHDNEPSTERALSSLKTRIDSLFDFNPSIG